MLYFGHVWYLVGIVCIREVLHYSVKSIGLFTFPSRSMFHISLAVGVIGALAMELSIWPV